MRYIFLLFFSSSLLFGKHDPLLPKYDKRCNAMLCKYADINPHKIEKQKEYFDQKIPLTIHQIWFGDKRKMPRSKTNLWEKYCELYGFQYRRWTEDDLEYIKSFCREENYNYIEKFINSGNYWAASDILRYEILNYIGGIYVDCDFSPPVWDNRMVDLREMMSFKGLTVVTEHHGRNIGCSAIFVCNGFIASAPEHPVLASAIFQLNGNIKKWYKKTSNYDAKFITGPFFFNKVLNGTYNIMPITYLKQFKMY